MPEAEVQEEKPRALHVVEGPRRLSESALWRLQRAYYSSSGVSAWATGTVPWFVTSNAAVARSYARVIDAFLRDVQASAYGPITDAARPIHIVELGAGHGRLSFLIVERLIALQARGATPKFRYVMTDFAESNLSGWLEHPRLQPYFASGVLDVARFDTDRDTRLELRVSNTVLEEGAESGPIVVVANYAFDSLVHDIFVVERGILHESWPALHSTEEAEDLDDPAILARLQLVYEKHRAEDEPYGEPDIDGILRRYAETLDDTAISLPIGAIRAIRKLDALSGGRTLLLSGDKGYLHAEDLSGREEPQPVIHGAFSFSVNYHAIAEWFRGRGGVILASTPRDSSFTINAFATVASAESLPLTRAAFDDAIEQFGPMDFMPLQNDYRGDSKISAESILALLRLGDYDPWLFYHLVEGLLDRLDSPQDSLRRDVRRTLERVWHNYYHLTGSTADLPFEMARVYARLESHGDALRLYEASVALFGDSHTTRHNMGLCHFRSQRYDEALRCFEWALEIRGDYAPSRSWKLRVLGEMRG